jgi:hypothetical protein
MLQFLFLQYILSYSKCLEINYPDNSSSVSGHLTAPPPTKLYLSVNIFIGMTNCFRCSSAQGRLENTVWEQAADVAEWRKQHNEELRVLWFTPNWMTGTKCSTEGDAYIRHNLETGSGWGQGQVVGSCVQSNPPSGSQNARNFLANKTVLHGVRLESELRDITWRSRRKLQDDTPTLSHTNLLQAPQSYFLKIHFNIILPPCLGLPGGFFFTKVSPQKPCVHL